MMTLIMFQRRLLAKVVTTAVGVLLVFSASLASRPPKFAGRVPCDASESYRCMGQNGRCVPPSSVCDGSKDCSLGDDEFFCQIPNDRSCVDRILCATDNACVDRTSVCDSKDDCPGRGDELGCDRPCPAQCQCGGYNLYCTGVPWDAVSASWVSRDTVNLFAMSLRPFETNSTTEGAVGGTPGPQSVADCTHLDLSEFKQLKIINLVHMQIGRLDADSFAGLQHVHTMGIYVNNVTVVEPRCFQSLASLQVLYLSSNALRTLPIGTFTGLRNLEQLHLDSNELMVLRGNVFEPLASLKRMNLMSNIIETIEVNAFRGLGKLQHLFLSTNHITELQPGTFEPLGRLKDLHLDGNRISFLRNGTFSGLASLKYLDVSANPLMVIEQGSFIGLKSIREMYMVLMEAEVDVMEPDMFVGLESLKSFSADDHRFCCLVGAECHTPPSPFATCEGLLRHTVLRMFIWILALSAVIGNIFVIFWRYKQRHLEPHNRVQILLILNLAVSDLLMGVYMIIIGCADGYFGQDYFLHANQWRSAVLCKLAGVISVTASEASMFMITVISVDRFMCIVFPFGNLRLKLVPARVTVAVVWLVALFLSLLPNVIERYVPGFYGLSDVCVGLPLATKSDYKASWIETDNLTFTFVFDEMDEKTPASYYAIFIFIVISLACFLVILVCYVAIFVSVQRSTKGTGRRRDRDEEIRMAGKMALIVGTDFACWMPIIIMGLLSQTGAVTIPVKTYAWTVVFVLPINSAINPYLYTISTLLVRHVQGAGPQGSSSKDVSQSLPLTPLGSSDQDARRRSSCNTVCTISKIDTDNTAQTAPMINPQ